MIHPWSIHDLLWSTLIYFAHLCSCSCSFLAFSRLVLRRAVWRWLQVRQPPSQQALCPRRLGIAWALSQENKLQDDGRHLATLRNINSRNSRTHYDTLDASLIVINSCVPWEAFVASPAPRAAPIQAEALLQSRPGGVPKIGLVGYIGVTGYLTIAVRSYI